MRHDATVTAGDVFRRTAELMGATSALASAAFLLLVGVGVVIDGQLAGRDAGQFLTFVLSVLSLVGQYWLTREALKSGGHRPVSGSLFGRFFLLSIILTILIGVGLVLLIVPGIILIVRLSASVPALIEEDLTVRDALDASWGQTKDHFRPLLQVFAAIWAPAVFVYVGIVSTGEPIGLVSAIAINLVQNASMIIGWHASAAVHLLTTRRETLTDVFA